MSKETLHIGDDKTRALSHDKGFHVTLMNSSLGPTSL